MTTNDFPEANLIPFQHLLGGHYSLPFLLGGRRNFGYVLEIFIDSTYKLELSLKTH